MLDKEMKIIHIPAKKGRVLFDVVKYYLLALVPEKRLVREDDLLEFISRKLKTNWVEFKRNAQDFVLNFEYFEGKDCSYKLVTSVGNVSNIYIEKLQQEGFELLPSTKYMKKVKDYKKYLYDFDLESNVGAELIELINTRGFISFSDLKI